MKMGEKLEEQCLSRAFQGWVEISSSISSALEHDNAWARLLKRFPTFWFREEFLLWLLFKLECGANAFRELQREGRFGD